MTFIYNVYDILECSSSFCRPCDAVSLQQPCWSHEASLRPAFRRGSESSRECRVEADFVSDCTERDSTYATDAISLRIEAATKYTAAKPTANWMAVNVGRILEYNPARYLVVSGQTTLPFRLFHIHRSEIANAVQQPEPCRDGHRFLVPLWASSQSILN